jgi:hypothetical protein
MITGRSFIGNGTSCGKIIRYYRILLVTGQERVFFERKEERTSFCEQKEAKKLYSFQCRAVSAPRDAAQKVFWLLRPDGGASRNLKRDAPMVQKITS